MSRASNYFEYFLIFISAVSGCALISAFLSLTGVPVGNASSEVGLKICTITAGIKKKEKAWQYSVVRKKLS